MTIALVIGLAAVGLFLSGFFSGTETGFYRATRVRMVLDALAGDWVAVRLVWLTNHASMFVATVLVGNNVANYITSLAIVMGTQILLPSGGRTVELIAPLVLAPLLFVYGELLPKNLFLQAPNRLLRRGGPLFFLFFVLFLPVSVLLSGLSRILGRLVGEGPEELQLALARRELHQVLEEGHEAGLLRPAQRALARGIFGVASLPVLHFLTPLPQVARARGDMSKEEVLRLARRYRIPAVPVESDELPGRLIGYVRVIDLELSNSNEVAPLRRLMEVSERTTQLAALTRMENGGEHLAQVVDAQAQLLGIVTAEQLREPLFRRR